VEKIVSKLTFKGANFGIQVSKSPRRLDQLQSTCKRTHTYNIPKMFYSCDFQMHSNLNIQGKKHLGHEFIIIENKISWLGKTIFRSTEETILEDVQHKKKT
jgi:ribosomal protein L28